MAQKALVKMDNTKLTGSNGGVVVAVEPIRTEYSFFPNHQYFTDFNGKKGYQIFTVRDEVKPGWILTSKTNMFVDSNVPPK